MKRRKFLIRTSMAAAVIACKSMMAFASSTEVQVKTADGLLLGEEVDGVRVFRGVPFAQPPVGELRFRAPQPVKPWTGTRAARDFSAAAMQPGDEKLKQSEDCLYLNVWSPAAPGPHPVFVWIHGGGFTGGHAFAPIFDGHKFASEGVVVVTVAYRLGVFGFMDMGGLLGNEYAGSANNALRDLILALRWVQANIAAFGGDAGKVTVGGESAGAKLTDILMGTPEARSLFHQMISESGGAERVWDKATATRIAQGFGELWTKERGETPAGLKTDSAASIIAAQQKFTAMWPQHFPLRCEVDGHLVPKLPIESIRQGSARGKRLLIGTNRDESALFIGAHPKQDATAADLGNTTVKEFANVYAQYSGIYPDMTVEQRRIRALTAEEYWIPSMRVVDAHAKDSGIAWMYRLDFAPSSGTYEGEAYHASELGLVWDKPNRDWANADKEAALATQVHAAWLSFIQGKSPAAPGLPDWPEYSSEERSTMIFNDVSKVERRPQDKELKLWAGLL